ncbi:MAG: Hsp20/alpha crystallin family protein [Gammaproteobacteria bacterium]
MNIVRYDPWSVFEKMSQEMNSLLNTRGGLLREGDDSSVVTGRWVPAVDIKEEPNQFVLHADIPGVDPKDIEITMDHSVLTVKGERKTESTQEQNGYKRVERMHGAFYRRFSLPDTADAERISAKGENGVLTITIPKKEKAQPRRISING